MMNIEISSSSSKTTVEHIVVCRSVEVNCIINAAKERTFKLTGSVKCYLDPFTGESTPSDTGSVRLSNIVWGDGFDPNDNVNNLQYVTNVVGFERSSDTSRYFVDLIIDCLRKVKHKGILVVKDLTKSEPDQDEFYEFVKQCAEDKIKEWPKSSELIDFVFYWNSKDATSKFWKFKLGGGIIKQNPV